jgi:tRNA nucleotidyltransferase (CCA-adding enzyme)
VNLQKNPTLSLPNDLYKHCQKVFELVANASGQAFLVGGCVRDALLGLPSKDIDIEVFGLDEQVLKKLLQENYTLIEVGKSFGVYKILGGNIDISLPRLESKTGPGHRGFTVYGDPHLSPEKAALRRDFTMNSILWDFISGELIDPFQGREDLQKSILRHTGPQFPEDPLRVLRAMQFAARFKLEVAPETIELCKNVYPETLSKERVFEEWKKLLTRGVTPSLGLKFLRNCGWVQYYPELLAMIGCKQDTTWHPEGDVWTHTLHCMDAFARERLNDSEEDLIVGFAVLCHDIGKPTTTVLEDGRIRSPGHESLGKSLTRNYLKRMTNQEDLIESIVPLVANHLRPMEFFKSNAGDSAIRRLANKVKRIDRLVRVASADEQGRPPKSHDLTAVNWLLSRASALKVKDSAPAPLVLGRHLIKIGLKPGNYFGEILSQCYEAQLEGSFFDLEGGRKYAANLIKNRNNSNEI